VSGAPRLRFGCAGGSGVVPVLSVLFVPLWASGFIAGKIATAHMQVRTGCHATPAAGPR
jgi:hypothetical protein